MARFRVAVLVGLLFAGTVRAQTPSEPVQGPIVSDPPSSEILDMARTARGNDWRFWVNAEYALAGVKAKNLPPLVTSSPAGTAQAAAGVVGAGVTNIMIGNTPITDELRSLGRFAFGLWFNPEKTLGMEAGFFVTESKGNPFSVASDGTAILARPFIDANTLVPTSVLVSFPGISSGSVNVFGAMQTFWGAHLDLREAFLSESWIRMESLFGYRYLRYGESLDMLQTLTAIGGAFVPGTTIASSDSFLTRHDYHGIEFGVSTEVYRERLSCEILTKMSAGNLRRHVTINGNTQITVPGTSTTSAVGGVYAQSSNIGTYANDNWTVAPEAGLNFGYQLTESIRLRLGYSFLFLPDIARAADQIDYTLNQNLFAPAVGGGPNRPAFTLVKSEIWIHSFNLGLDFRF